MRFPERPGEALRTAAAPRRAAEPWPPGAVVESRRRPPIQSRPTAPPQRKDSAHSAVSLRLAKKHPPIQRRDTDTTFSRIAGAARPRRSDNTAVQPPHSTGPRLAAAQRPGTVRHDVPSTIE